LRGILTILVRMETHRHLGIAFPPGSGGGMDRLNHSHCRCLVRRPEAMRPDEIKTWTWCVPLIVKLKNQCPLKTPPTPTPT